MAIVKWAAKIATMLPVAACAIVSGVLYVLTTPLILLSMWLCAIRKEDDTVLSEMRDAWLTGITLPARSAVLAYNYIWRK